MADPELKKTTGNRPIMCCPVTTVTGEEASGLAGLFAVVFPEYTRRAAWRLHEDLSQGHDATVMPGREPFILEQDNASRMAEPNGTDALSERG